MMAYKGVGRSPDPVSWLVLGALGLGGIYLLSKMGEGEGGGLPQPQQDGIHKFQNLDSPSFAGSSVYQVSLAEKPVIVCQVPSVEYMGPDVDVFTYFRVMQSQPNGLKYTVYGSGVAGIHLYGAASWRPNILVASDQPQPPECKQTSDGQAINPRTLCAFYFPGPPHTPICGTYPRPGLADVYLEIYGRVNAADADGFSSPSCGEWGGHPQPRTLWERKKWPGKIQFV